MKLFSVIEKAFKALLPSPFSIALILTVLTFLLAWFVTDSNTTGLDRGLELVGYWKDGLWEEPQLAFAVQMMLMLVLGHVLALTKPVDRFIGSVTKYCTNTANSAAIVTFLTVLVALFNWGLGLIFGAILARKVGEHAAKKGINLNYALIGAAGYSGLMVWHGGISGSAPIKVAEKGHMAKLMDGIVPIDQLSNLPDSVSPSETMFGTMNIVVIAMLLILLPLYMYFLGNRTKRASKLPHKHLETAIEDEAHVSGADRVDHSLFFALLFGLFIIAYSVYVGVEEFAQKGFGIINPNSINLLLLGLGLTMHGSIRNFLNGVDKAIGGTSGILIQFPLYFGIMGIMKYSGLVQELSDFFVQISTTTTFPLFTFLSAGIVNVFVPSGGGQWAVQGPIIVQAASELNVSLPKAIMALSYGDQLTNMLQPFWALPLLGITGLKAKQILPYTVALMGVGGIIFICALIIF
jgi:short-chain fatty acids transporter